VLSDLICSIHCDSGTATGWLVQHYCSVANTAVRRAVAQFYAKQHGRHAAACAAVVRQLVEMTWCHVGQLLQHLCATFVWVSNFERLLAAAGATVNKRVSGLYHLPCGAPTFQFHGTHVFERRIAFTMLFDLGCSNAAVCL
jgi:hypothetical protein